MTLSIRGRSLTCLLSGIAFLCQSVTATDIERQGKKFEVDAVSENYSVNVKPSLISVGSFENPTIEQVMASGQLGGVLHPNIDVQQTTLSLEQRDSLAVQNSAFAKAMDEWNSHNYKHAYSMMEDYLQRYPNGLWAGEADLHMGCEARFNGRYREANERFTRIIKKFENSRSVNARLIAEKAKSRLAVLKVMENNPEGAEKMFYDLKADGKGWRQRTYATSWVQRISRLKSKGKELANCGNRAFSELLKREGKVIEAEQVQSLVPEQEKGFSIHDLSNLASQYGYHMKALKVETQQLSKLPLPAIAHVDRSDTGGLGHYWIVENISDEGITVYDEQKQRRFVQTSEEFSKEWDGTLLVFASNDRASLSSLPGTELSALKASETYGGCCGIQRPESGLGDPGKFNNDCSGYGCPVFRVNRVNMNLYVTDTPLWYDTPYGPDVEFKLSYNSLSALQQYEPFGNKWSFSYGSYLVEDPGKAVTVFKGDGERAVYISDGNGGFEKAYGDDSVLVKEHATKYTLTQPDGTVFTYELPHNTQSQQVMLTEIKDLYDHKITLHYNASIQLERVEDAQGRSTVLRYNASGRVKEIQDPFGRKALFAYDAHGNLEDITDMGSYTSTIGYDDNVFITSIKRPVEGTYTFKTELPDGIQSSGYPREGYFMWEYYRITVTHPNGKKSEYFYAGNENGWYVSPRDYIEYQDSDVNSFASDKEYYNFISDDSGRGEISEVAFSNDPQWNGQVFYSYDSHGRIKSIKKSGRNKTDIIYNASGQLEAVKEAVGTSSERVTQFEFLNTHINLPTKVTYAPIDDGSFLEQIIDYDSSQRPEYFHLKQTDTNGVASFRTSRFEYNDNHQVRLVDGPRTDVSDITTMTYYDCSMGISYCGQLHTMTNALGHVTTFSDYTLDGKVGRVVDANGLTVLYTYDNLGRSKTITQFSDENPAQTRKVTYEYEGVNRVKSVSWSDGRSMTYTYDSMGHVEKVVDEKGERIEYVNDDNGNQKVTKFFDAAGIVKHQINKGFDTFSNVSSLTDSLNQTTAYEFHTSQLSQVTFPDNEKTYYSYDDLERNSNVSFDLLDTGKEYNNYDRITKVTGANQLSTTYTYNAFGDLLERNSPDTGKTTYTYYPDGNLKTVKDARGTEVVISYDALNRPLKADYVNDAEDIIYHYDDINSDNQGKGRLTKIQDESGVTEYHYDDFGQVSKVTQHIASHTFITEYHYNRHGQLESVKYPSGKVIGYQYDGEKVAQVSLTHNGESQTLVDQHEYLPFGPLNQMRYGNGLVLNRHFNLDYRLESTTVGNLINKSYTYTKNNLVSHINDNLNPDDSIASKIDKFGRVEVEQLPNAFKVFEYDTVGNRTKTLTCEFGRFGVNTGDDCINLYQKTKNECTIERCEPDFCSHADDPFCYEPEPPCDPSSDPYCEPPVCDPNLDPDCAPACDPISDPSCVPPCDIDSDPNCEPPCDTNVDPDCNGTLPCDTLPQFCSTAPQDACDGTVSMCMVQNNDCANVETYCALVSTEACDNLKNYCLAMTMNFKNETARSLLTSNQSFLTLLEQSKSDSKTSTSNTTTTSPEPKYELYHYADKSHLSSLNNTLFSYDEMGNTKSKGNWLFEYNHRGRLSSAVSSDSIASYQYNAAGQRAIKTVDGTPTIYLYSLGGMLIAEVDQHGVIKKEYVYQHNEPLALLENDSVYFYHNSHIGTPEILTDKNQNVVWQAKYDAFGNTTINTELVVNNIRFAGQYFDSETGFHYNWMRYYDPQTGRYITSDPIGLAGGINTYVYALNNPLTFNDPTGEIVPHLIYGFMMGAGFNFLTQMIAYQGNIACVDWWQVGASGVLGALIDVSVMSMFHKLSQLRHLSRMRREAMLDTSWMSNPYHPNWRYVQGPRSVGAAQVTKGGRVHIDVGGEGRFADAINLNPGTLTTTTGAAGKPIPNLVQGVGNQMPFKSNAADVITLQNAPISNATASEIARVIKSGGKVRLQSPSDYATTAHQRVIDAVGGTARQRTSSGMMITIINVR
ncbi:RHS repeat-associated core domain-containing protein [Pleionea sp. CnH1-48]|uniref:RHS repeat-associated core domain-containing protein n=1 Tax=Pleionea sp. CnH1-48 TaxID=2954494 RepID=UPI00273A5F94|nr:RHS repeat-associated core domain-containing protein [Pleionea sp. CnH1-48]